MKKRCTRCKKIKPISEFNKRSRSKDGYDIYCKACRKVYYDKQNEQRKAMFGCKTLAPYFKDTLRKFIKIRYGTVQNAADVCDVNYTSMFRLLNYENARITIWTLDKICVKLLGAPISYYEAIGAIR